MPAGSRPARGCGTWDSGLLLSPVDRRRFRRMRGRARRDRSGRGRAQGGRAARCERVRMRGCRRSLAPRRIRIDRMTGSFDIHQDAGDWSRSSERAREPARHTTRHDRPSRQMIPVPSKIVCAGLNYRDHAAEQGVDSPNVRFSSRSGRTLSSRTASPFASLPSRSRSTTRRSWAS